MAKRRKLKSYLDRRAQALERQRQRRLNRLYNGSTLPLNRQSRSNLAARATDIHNAPRTLSLAANTEEVVSFFNGVKVSYSKGHKIALDLTDVAVLTPDAIIYMLSQMDYYERRYGRTSVSGNVPDDLNCRKLFVMSGFMKYVHFVGQLPASDTDVLTIERGAEVKNDIATQVVTFAREKLGAQRASGSKSVYRIIVESMGNTREHAYDETAVAPNWYLIAQNHPTSERVSFAFLDGGAGIPATVRKKLTEEMRQQLSLLPGLKIESEDAKMIMSAFAGKIHRSKTRKGYRGRGLPGIYKILESGLIDNLIVISGFGYVDYRNNKVLELKLPFEGTLILWDFLP